MSVVVFLGPTLSTTAARSVLDATYLPPAAQGDVYRAALSKPWGIAIIDGYFERLPAVWHKEVLWAMSQGIHVFGASSMGALRAIELMPFGMVGCGRIYEGFRNGTLTDDDEVAVVHGEEDSNYRSLSTAMVDIRATLAAAHAAGVVSDALHAELVQLAKGLHYSERSYPRLIERWRETRPEPSAVERLKAWLESGKVSQKRLDAVELLETVADRRRASNAPFQANFAFEHTDAWEQVTRRWGQTAASARTVGEDGGDVLEELLLQPETFRKIVLQAMLTALSLDTAKRHGLRVDDQALRNAVESFRREHELPDRKSVDDWLAARELDAASFGELLQRRALTEIVTASFWSALRPLVLDELRLSDRYPYLRTRARDKHRALEARGLSQPALSELGITEADLLEWHASRTGTVDSGRECVLRHEDRNAFVRALMREYLYARNG